jgi:hypothetical protein
MVKKSSGREKLSNKTNNKVNSTKFEKFSISNRTTSSTFNEGLNIILLIIILLININASIWIAKLEKINCACSDNFMRNYIKYFLFVMIPIIIIQICVAIYVYFNVSYVKSANISATILMIIVFLKFVFGIFYIINICIAIIYINRLKELNCECSEDIRREVYWIYNIILAAILCIFILMLIVLVLIVRFTKTSFNIRITSTFLYYIILIVFVSYLIFYYQNLLPK